MPPTSPGPWSLGSAETSRRELPVATCRLRRMGLPSSNSSTTSLPRRRMTAKCRLTSPIPDRSLRVAAVRENAARPPPKMADVEEPALVEPIGFFDDPRKKWATIIGTGLLVIVGVAGGLVWSLGGGEATPDASAEKSLASAEPTPAAPAAPVTENELELDDDLDLGSRFGGGEESSANAKMPAEEEQPSSAPSESEKPQDPQGDTTPTPPEAEKSSPSKADAAAPKADEPRPKETPKEPAKEQPKKEEAKQEEPKKEEPKKEEPKKAPKAQPFKDFPKAASIPILSDNDPIGEASKAPLTLAAVRGPTNVNWQMLLVGGDKVLKGGRALCPHAKGG